MIGLIHERDIIIINNYAIIIFSIYFRIVWILGSNKTNGDVRTLGELIPNYNQDGYLPNPVLSRDTFTINTVTKIKWPQTLRGLSSFFSAGI